MPPPVETADPPSGSRPSREEIAPAAADLLRRRGDEIMRTAHQYAATPEDADDAYQRGLEILLTKAPSTDEDQLLPWLKTVVKHEAFALRRQRERAVAVETETLDVMAGREPASDQRYESYERLRVGAEALDGLKPQERRALLLKAEGYSYNQICEITSWTYTKVNRCLTEGRRRFIERVSGIESGGECDRLAPLLSRLADGEADADDMRVLRPHLRGCGSCRATLANYRRAPAAVAALASGVPFVVMDVMQHGATSGGSALASAADWLTGWLRDGAGALWTKAQAVADAVTLHKAAAIAASTAAVAGGGAATVQSIDGAPPKPRDRSAVRTPAPPAPGVERSAPRRASSGGNTRPASAATLQREPAAEPAPASPTSAPSPASEPATSAPASAPSRPQPTRAPAPEPPPDNVDGGEFGP